MLTKRKRYEFIIFTTTAGTPKEKLDGHHQTRFEGHGHLSLSLSLSLSPERVKKT